MTIEDRTTDNVLKKAGCGLLLLTAFASVWVIALSGIDMFMNWIVEQSLFESSSVVQDFRWINHAICSGLILLMCVILTITVKHPRIRMIFRLWTVAAILAVIALPLKMLYMTAQNETAIFQIMAMLLLFAGTQFFKRRSIAENDEKKKTRTPLSGLFVILCALMCIPWLLWGALGSIEDTILAIVVGVIFSWLAMRFAFSIYLEKVQVENRVPKTSDLFLDGFVVAVFLLIMAAALSQNGSQQLWVLTVPVMGWLIALLSENGKNIGDHGKLAAEIILALAVALPLLFFDMDELSPVFTGGDGEILGLSIKAAWFTFIGLISTSVIISPSIRAGRKIVLPKRSNIGLMVIGLAGVIAVYLFWGQVGFFGDNQFIVLKQQADLSTIEQNADPMARRQAVYETLVKSAQTSQIDLRARLDKLHLKYTSYYLLNAIEVKGGNLVKIILQNDPSIDRILASPQLRPLPDAVQPDQGEVTSLPDETLWNLSMIQSDRVIKELGIDGSGILIGQTDSGVDGSQPELINSYRGAKTGDDYNWYDPWNRSPFPTDISGHGTMTLGVAMGQHTGVAPGAQWIGCVNLARNLGNPAYYLDCMQFMLAPFPQSGDPFKDGDPSRGAMVVNNSWGCPFAEGCDTEIFASTAKALKTAGIFMSVAAGNSGNYGCGTVSDPMSIYADVFTIGSVNKSGNLSDFSSRGPVFVDGSGRSKPDLVAPGEDILSPFPGGNYSIASGTSFAAPHVTGVVALMWSANPALIGNIDATSEILRESTTVFHGNDNECGVSGNEAGTGILDAFQAVNSALEYDQDVP